MTVGSSNRLAYEVDQVQYAIGQGRLLAQARRHAGL
jgi:hypothetical protein